MLAHLRAFLRFAGARGRGPRLASIRRSIHLGSIERSSFRATVDLEMKRKAIEQPGLINDASAGLALRRTEAWILTWLEAL